jgi:hypothetical protein
MPPSAVAIIASRRSCCRRRPTRATPRTQPPRAPVPAVPHERHHRRPIFVTVSPTAHNTSTPQRASPCKIQGFPCPHWLEPLRGVLMAMANSARPGDVGRGVDGGGRLHTPLPVAQLIASREHPLPPKPACGRVWHLEGAEDRRFELASRGFQSERRCRFHEPIADPRGRGHDPFVHRNGVTVLLTRLRGLRGVASARQGPCVIHAAAPIGRQKHAPAPTPRPASRDAVARTPRLQWGRAVRVSGRWISAHRTPSSVFTGA